MITKASFVGIVVRDIEEAQKLYTDVLGLKAWDEGVVDMPGVKVLMFPMDGCAIELLQPTAGPGDPIGGSLARLLAKRGEGFCRLGFWTDNIDEDVRRLSETDIQIVDSGEYGEIGKEYGAMMAFIHPKSASGVLIELDQQMQERAV